MPTIAQWLDGSASVCHNDCLQHSRHCPRMLEDDRYDDFSGFKWHSIELAIRCWHCCCTPMRKYRFSGRCNTHVCACLAGNENDNAYIVLIFIEIFDLGDSTQKCIQIEMCVHVCVYVFILNRCCCRYGHTHTAAHSTAWICTVAENTLNCNLISQENFEI